MNLDSVGKLFFFIEVVNSAENIVAEKLLILLSEISLDLCDQSNRLIGFKEALHGAETDELLGIVLSKLLRSN